MNDFVKTPVAIDVNVLFDAVNLHSENHEQAKQALSTNKDRPLYISDAILETTAIKLIEHGADPKVVEEYMLFLMGEREPGDPDIHVIQKYPIRDYSIKDRYDKHDVEDNVIISLISHIEKLGNTAVSLITKDYNLTNWCKQNNIVAFTPKQFNSHEPNYSKSSHRNLSYISTRITDPNRSFPEKIPKINRENAVKLGTSIVKKVRSQVEQEQYHPPPKPKSPKPSINTIDFSRTGKPPTKPATPARYTPTTPTIIPEQPEDPGYELDF